MQALGESETEVGEHDAHGHHGSFRSRQSALMRIGKPAAGIHPACAGDARQGCKLGLETALYGQFKFLGVNAMTNFGTRSFRGIALTLAALAVGGAAVAEDQELADAAMAAFTAADFDQNGKVSWEEFRNRVVGVFGQMDKDGDGQIAGGELPPAVDESGAVAQPGTVSAESFTASVAAAFKASDKDGDGELSADEWSGH